MFISRSSKSRTNIHCTRRTFNFIKPCPFLFQEFIKCPYATKSPALPTVDVVLKKFYKQVHPDLFVSDPEKRKTNSESFALLQNFLHIIKDPFTEHDSLSYQTTTLKFFTTQHPTAPASPVTLDPIMPGDPQAKRERHLHASLVKLFSACGFETGDFNTTGFAGPPPVLDRYAGPGEMTLVKFLMSVMARRKKLDRQDEVNTVQKLNQYATDLANIYKIKKFAFEIQEHTFLDGKERANRRIHLLSRFGAIVDDMIRKGVKLENVAGSFIVFGKRSGIDSKGRLGLHVNGSNQQWAELLESYDNEKMRAAINNAKNRTQMEQKVAEVLGITKFYCDSDVENLYSYDLLMENIISHFQKADLKCDWPSGLCVRICNSDQVTSEPTIATLVLPISIPYTEIHTLLTKGAKPTLQDFQKFRKSTEVIKNHLGMVSLTYQTPPDLNDLQLWECFGRLAKASSRLQPFMKGIKLHVGNEYGVQEETNVLSIKWDYLD